MKKIVIDSSNYLPEMDKTVVSTFDSSTKLHQKFTDSLVFVWAEGALVDTSTYKIVKDTIFYIHNDTFRDTSIILKLTHDSLIERSLPGLITYSVLFKR